MMIQSSKLGVNNFQIRLLEKIIFTKKTLNYNPSIKYDINNQN